MQDHSNETVAILAGIGIGAALMFFLDPHRQNGRRPHSVGGAPPALRALRDVEVIREESENDVQQAELATAEMR